MDAGDRGLAAAGHAHVDHGEVGLVDVRGVRGVVATRDGSHDAEPAVGLEQLLDRSAHDDLVVGQQHSDHGSVSSPAPAFRPASPGHVSQSAR